MQPIRFVLPSEDLLPQIWDYREECRAADSSMDGCGPLRRAESPRQWLELVRAYTSPRTLPPGKVVATQLLSVGEEDGKLVGMLQIRHYLNDYLETYGGHIGYSVRPALRRQGYGKEQLRLGLLWCRENLGLSRVLITCLTDNEPSRRTILSQGGVFDGVVHQPEENVDLERYWIQL